VCDQEVFYKRDHQKAHQFGFLVESIHDATAYEQNCRDVFMVYARPECFLAFEDCAFTFALLEQRYPLEVFQWSVLFYVEPNLSQK
jgi:hypothetical protein